jgi:hypothetical protein
MLYFNLTRVSCIDFYFEFKIIEYHLHVMITEKSKNKTVLVFFNHILLVSPREFI